LSDIGTKEDKLLKKYRILYKLEVR
jgi:hypothetical protein